MRFGKYVSETSLNSLKMMFQLEPIQRTVQPDTADTMSHKWWNKTYQTSYRAVDHVIRNVCILKNVFLLNTQVFSNNSMSMCLIQQLNWLWHLWFWCAVTIATAFWGQGYCKEEARTGHLKVGIIFTYEAGRNIIIVATFVNKILHFSG